MSRGDFSHPVPEYLRRRRLPAASAPSMGLSAIMPGPRRAPFRRIAEIVAASRVAKICAAKNFVIRRGPKVFRVLFLPEILVLMGAGDCLADGCSAGECHRSR